jgi:hypothetical protein
VSALEIRKVAGGIRCSVPGCKRTGRCEYYLLGYPVIIGERRELLCEPCSREWKKAFAQLAPSRKYMEGLVADIGASATKRLDAINDLRELGFSPDHIAQAVKGIAERVEVGEILDRMLGAGDLEAVA